MRDESWKECVSVMSSIDTIPAQCNLQYCNSNKEVALSIWQYTFLLVIIGSGAFYLENDIEWWENGNKRFYIYNDRKSDNHQLTPSR